MLSNQYEYIIIIIRNIFYHTNAGLNLFLFNY